jgi:SAM-dependent methyltransferase
MSPLPHLRAALRLATLALALATAPVFAAPCTDAPYARRTATIDGIGKVFMGREIAQVMGWQGAPWLERDERATEERPDLLLPALELAPGMVVADVGAGTGYWTRRLAAAVGERGVVHAVDVQPQMVAILANMVERRRLANVRTLQSAPDDVRLPPSSIDLAIMVDVYHELEAPCEMLGSIVRALKPGGRVVFVEYKGEDPRVPIKPLHKMTEAQVKREAAPHGLEWVRTIATLPWQHAIVFRKP